MIAAHLLFITDPWDSLDHPRDTTLRWIEEATRLDIPCSWADARSIRWTPEGPRLRAQRVKGVGSGRTPQSFRFDDSRLCAPAEFTTVLYRTDPPVDLAYLHPLLLLRTDPSAVQPEYVNPLALLLSHCEKLEAAFAPELLPPTLCACEREPLLGFALSEGETIVKPLHQCQSKGVDLLRWRTPQEQRNSEAVLRSMTDEYRRPVLLQRYLPAVHKGETRLWFLDGQLLAVAEKQPANGTFRIDMDKGGTLRPHDLQEQELRLVPLLSAQLLRIGARLAAVDVIDGHVTDFNLTSPGLIPSIEEVLGLNFARPIVEALAGRLTKPVETQGRGLPARSEEHSFWNSPTRERDA